ncbi:MAG: beta-ureidopropionase [Deinococcus sp.]|nr:beta-ureidopropionase [Deinococcus sp.]
MKLVLAQTKPKKGDYSANVAKVGEIFTTLAEKGLKTDLLCLPEACLSGYFLQGGVLDVARTAEQALADLQRQYQPYAKEPLDICLGFYEAYQDEVYNAALYATLGPEPQLIHVHRKLFLPTYGVFDEERFVGRGQRIQAFDTRFGRCAILICEDAWHSLSATIAALQGAELLFVPAASPGRGLHSPEPDNVRYWKRLAQNIAEEHGVFVINAALCGFEGGKGLSGGSSVVDPTGVFLLEAPVLQECLLPVELDRRDLLRARYYSPLLSDLRAALPTLLRELREVLP